MPPVAPRAPSPSPPDPTSAPTPRPITLSRRGPAVSGWLYNDKGVSVSNVRLRVEVLDATGGVLAKGEGWLYGNVPGRGRAYFFITVPRHGEGYRVTVLSYDRLEMGGP